MMKKKGILAGMLAVLLALSACGAQSPQTGDEEDAGVAVQVTKVTSESIATDNRVSAQVVAEDEATVMVAVTAKCTAVYVKAGDEVRKGDILCTLDLDSTLSSYSAARIGYSAAVDSYNDQAALFDQQIALAEKQIAMSEEQITLTQQQIDLMGPQIDLAEKSLNDLKELFAIGAASQLEVDNAQIQFDQAVFQRDQAKFQREQLGLSLDQSRMQLQQLQSTKSSTLSQLEAGIQSSLSSVQQMDHLLEDVDGSGNVLAPISGTLVSFNATENNYVSSSMPLAVIHGEDQMKLTASVSEALVPKLSVGDEADVTISALGLSLTATVRSVERAASAQTRLYTVTLSLPEGTEGLMTGMFADVTFHTDRVENAVVIPSEAILTSGSTQFVYVVEGDAAKYVAVTTGLTGSGVTEILSGLTGGERLVTVGQSYLSDGETVRVVAEE